MSLWQQSTHSVIIRQSPWKPSCLINSLWTNMAKIYWSQVDKYYFISVYVLFRITLLCGIYDFELVRSMFFKLRPALVSWYCRYLRLSVRPCLCTRSAKNTLVRIIIVEGVGVDWLWGQVDFKKTKFTPFEFVHGFTHHVFKLVQDFQIWTKNTS